MLTFFSDELVWAMRREREEDARNVRPHTSSRPDGERRANEHAEHRATETWVAPYLRAGVAGGNAS
jgi:hypothetical protein